MATLQVDQCEACTLARTKLDAFSTAPVGQLKHKCVELRWWDFTCYMQTSCTLCHFVTEMCKAQSFNPRPFHDYATLYAYTIRQNEFDRRPQATSLYLEFQLSCGYRVWYFIEDEAIDPTERTVGQAHHARTMLSDTDWILLKTWINACEENHRDTCFSPGAIDFAGFEVIDCKTREIRPARDGEEFAALSYVWGNWNAHQVLSKQAFLPDNLSEKVIEDALSCTANLGIPCLWVDRYCIDQLESSHNSKQQLIQNMDKVYSAARVTIISVAGDDARTGLPGVSSVPRLSLFRASICGRRVVQVSNPNEEIAKSRWASRGWTLQEGLLARRRLIFTNTQVYFQCNRVHCIETVSGILNSDQDLDAHGGPFTELRDFRLRIQVFPTSSVGSSSFSVEKVCNEFSRRVLTKDEDALEACLGIFSRLWGGTSPVYQYWGLPFHSSSEKSFMTALLWGAERIGHYARPTRRAQIPSWSWVAWKGYVGFGRPGTTRDTRQAQSLIKIRVRNSADEQPSTIAEYVQDINSGGVLNNGFRIWNLQVG